jgi:hypothetical protein
MGWAVTMEGRADPAAIVLLIEERDEAESIAREICSRGTRVVVRPYPVVGMAPPPKVQAEFKGRSG